MEEWILYTRYYGQSSSVEPPTQRWLQPIAGCVQCDSSQEMEWPVAERRGWAIEVWIVDRMANGTRKQRHMRAVRTGRNRRMQGCSTNHVRYVYMCGVESR